MGLSIGRVAGRFECGQIALVMRQQGAEYAVADIESVAIFFLFFFSLCSCLKSSDVLNLYLELRTRTSVLLLRGFALMQ